MLLPQGNSASNVPSSAFPLLATDGTAAAPSYSFASDPDTGIYWTGANTIDFTFSGTKRMSLGTSFTLGSGVSLGWSASASAATTFDTVFVRQAAGSLGLHNAAATSAQLSIFNTRTDASNYEALEQFWASNVCVIRVGIAGTGTARSMAFRYANTTSNFLLVPSSINSEGAIAAGNVSIVNANGRVTISRTASNTSTTGTHYTFRIGENYSPSSSSTMDALALTVDPTINYASGGAGRIRLAYFNPTNTALPTGLNAAITLSATASTLGGIQMFATSDEATNYEFLKIGYVSGNTQYELVSTIGGSGTLRDIATSMGSGTGRAKLIGNANTNTTAVGNVGAGEDDLITYAMPASSFHNAGKRVHIKAWGTTANTANSKTLKVYFGTQIVLTNALTVNLAGIWRVEADIISTGTDTQDYIAQLVTTGAAGVALNDVETGTATQDDGAAITIKCTGEATSNNDIVQEGMIVEFSA